MNSIKIVVLDHKSNIYKKDAKYFNAKTKIQQKSIKISKKFFKYAPLWLYRIIKTNLHTYISTKNKLYYPEKTIFTNNYKESVSNTPS